MAIKKLYTTSVKATGGRGNGTATSDDGLVNLRIGQPKKLGGDDTGLNPEQLFGAGYANCYLGAIKYVAGKEKKPVEISPESSVTAHVHFGPRADKKGFGIEVRLDVKLPGVKKAAATALAKKAHVVCPYSHAIRKNVKVTTKIV